MLVLSDFYVMTLADYQLGTSTHLPVMNVAEVYLYCTPLAPTPNTVYADLDQPTYTGYVPVAILWGIPYQVRPGVWEAISTVLFNAKIQSGDPPTTIAGYAIVLPSGTLLLAAEDFPAPYSLNNDSQLLSFAVKFRFGDPENNGTAVIVTAP